MGMITRDAALAMESPALNTLWRLTVPFVQYDTHIFAENMSATWPKIPSRPRATAGSNTYYPEVMDIDGISATFYETERHDVTRWFANWQSLICDSDGNYGVPKDYKKDCVAELFARTELSSPILTLRYSGVWPTDKSPYQLSYDDETGRLTVEVQFATDSVEIVYS